MIGFFYKFILFMLGASLGSFVSLVSDRRKLGESIIAPSSHCDFCKQKLYKRDLIPVFSYVILRGRCRFCKEKISPKKLIIEVICGLIFIFTFNSFNLIRASLLSLSLIVGLLISVDDLRLMEIYDFDLCLLGGLGIFYRASYLGFDFGFFKFALIFSLVFLLIKFLSKAGIGDGDLFFYLDLFLFVENELLFYFFLISVWIGAIFGIGKAIRYKNLKLKLAFCPSIYLAYILILFYEVML